MLSLERILKIMLWMASAVLIMLFFWCAIHRLFYPYELYHEEGLAADHVQRILEGKKLYVAPSMDFIPFIYTPLYFYISAFFSKIIGFSFIPLRLVSILAATGTALIIFRWIQREGGNLFYATLTTALFLALYPAGLTFYDVGKPDMLFVFFSVAAFYVFCFSKNRFQIMLSSVLFLAAFLTKQSALFFLAPFIIYVLLFSPSVRSPSDKSLRKESFGQIPNPFSIRWIFPVLTITLIILSVLILNLLTDGWFNFYIFKLPGNHPFRWESLWMFWQYHILLKYSFLFFLCLSLIFLLRAQKDSKRFWFYGFFFAGMMGCSWLSAIHNGDANVLIPANTAMALLTGIALVKIDKLIQRKELSWLRSVLLLCVLIQFADMYYKPASLIPRKSDQLVADALMNELKNTEGEIWFVYHGHYNYMLGKKMHANESSLLSLMEGDKKLWREKIMNEIRAAIDAKKFALVVTDLNWLENELSENYTREEISYPDANSFIPACGWRTRPKFIYRVKVD